jgi:hypothetical protein
MGASVFGVVSPYTLDNNRDEIDPCLPPFNAKGDGITDDWAAIQAALDTGKNVKLRKAVYRVTDELTMITPGQQLLGCGKGWCYWSGTTQHPVLHWRDNTTILFDTPSNPAVRYVKTRIKHRTNAASPKDAAISTAINIQAEGVRVDGLCVRLKIWNVPAIPSTDSPTNYGADWDAGIFVGTRNHVTINEVAVIGYWRKASIWVDDTNGSNLPRFTNHRGVQFPVSSVEHGADGFTLTNSATAGGFWAVYIRGADWATGYTDYGPNYYDDVPKPDGSIAGSVTDNRGSFGCSDVHIENNVLYGPDHHTYRRVKDIASPPNVATDECGGVILIDGAAGNASGRIQGQTLIRNRFSTWAPFLVCLRKANRVKLVANHTEFHSGDGKSTTGAALAYDSTDCYGPYAKTADTQRTHLLLASGSPYDVYYPRRLDDSELVSDSTSANYLSHETTYAGIDADGTESNRLAILGGKTSGSSVLCFADRDNLFAGSFRYLHSSGKFLMRSETSGIGSGDMFYWYMSPTIPVFESLGNGMIIRNGGSFQLQTMAGATLLQAYSSGNVEVTGNIRPATHNNRTCGEVSLAWSQVYAQSGTILPSDERLKQDISSLEEALYRAAEKINFVQYRFISSYLEKGDKARYHLGWIAQRVKEAFESEGIDPFKYGILGYDEWEDVYEPIMRIDYVEALNEEGKPYMKPVEVDTGEKKLVRAAGNQYSLRETEMLALQVAYLRHKLGV